MAQLLERRAARIRDAPYLIEGCFDQCHTTILINGSHELHCLGSCTIKVPSAVVIPAAMHFHAEDACKMQMAALENAFRETRPVELNPLAVKNLLFRNHSLRPAKAPAALG